MIPEAVLTAIFDDPSRRFDVELWNGRVLRARAHGPTRGRVVLGTPAVLSRLIPPADERRLAEAFVAGEVDIVGDMIDVLEAIASWNGPRVHPLALPWLTLAGAHALATRVVAASPSLRPRHSVARDARAVRKHYDLSDDFFRLFLDDAMVYSCAYFPRGDESIEEAQLAKLELVCRKLGLRREDRLLDVGCGWGALLVHAAERFGVHAIGTTISRNQAALARLRATESAANARIEVLECDYRELPLDPVDKIVSVGMMEHVGIERLGTYFRALHDRLAPGGVVLNHAIACSSDGKLTIPWLRQSAGTFIGREIFPDSEMPPLAAVIAAAESEGFEVQDVDGLREHYAQTLRQWLSRLERRAEDARALVGERTLRAWRLYLAVSALAFRLGRLGIFQTLLVRRSDRASALAVPRTRADWYRTPLAQKPAVARAAG